MVAAEYELLLLILSLSIPFKEEDKRENNGLSCFFFSSLNHSNTDLADCNNLPSIFMRGEKDDDDSFSATLFLFSFHSCLKGGPSPVSSNAML